MRMQTSPKLYAKPGTSFPYQSLPGELTLHGSGPEILPGTRIWKLIQFRENGLRIVELRPISYQAK